MDPLTPPPLPSQRQGNWWQRNWKWFVPTGCLGLLALVVGFVAIIVFVVFGAMKSSDVYKTALAKAKADRAVAEALGSPLEEGMFLSGKTNVDGASGEADLAIPISGPKGKGTLYVVASKSAGEWSFTTMVVQIHKTGEKIDLNDQEAP